MPASGTGRSGLGHIQQAADSSYVITVSFCCETGGEGRCVCFHLMKEALCSHIGLCRERRCCVEYNNFRLSDPYTGWVLTMP